MPDVRHIFIAGGLVAASALPAFALDADDMLAKMKAAYEAESGVTFTYDNVQPQGDDGLSVEFTSISITDDGAGEFALTKPLTVTMTDITENGDGSYTIGHTASGDIAFSMGEANITIASSEQENVHIPATPATDTFSGWVFADSGTVKDVSITVDGDEIATIDSGEVRQPMPSDGTKATFDGSLTGLTLMLGKIDDLTDEARQNIEKLDLEETHTNIDMSGSWDQTSGVLDIARINFDTENVGTLELAMKFTGFDVATMQQFRELGAMDKPSAEEIAAKTEAAQAYQAKVLATTGKIGIASMSISFIDDSITEKALEIAGAKQGLTATEMADTLATQASAGLAGLNAPGVSEMAYKAVDTYLHDPQNISVSVQPTMQTPLIALFIAAASAPQSIPQLLGLKIEANQ
ncbi:hypothetical protein [Martelella endophytica]|uniref:DUF945 domain-containing protein n=1 Tax=Martelella endophytica TaxID=1486262 RepID=A0A0D5LV98_MAREN|nr:hypothetical protein [Martelella endophytica]AJY47687.1 hypothetical protein TM49_21655 [Martelella endophytica]